MGGVDVKDVCERCEREPAFMTFAGKDLCDFCLDDAMEEDWLDWSERRGDYGPPGQLEPLPKRRVKDD